MRDDPLIFTRCAVMKPKSTPSKTKGSNDRDDASMPEATEQKGELLILDLWQNGTVRVHDMRVIKTDAKSHLEKQPEKCLQKEERAKKLMYLQVCLQQRRHFTPLLPWLTDCWVWRRRLP